MSVYFVIAKLLTLGYIWTTNEECKLGEFGLHFAASSSRGFKKSGNVGRELVS